jgi:hypothetical protein
MVRYPILKTAQSSVSSMLSMNRSSFRYEVKVTTPHFEIATMDECHFQTSFHLSEDKPLPKYPALFRPNKSRYLNSPRNRVALVGDFVSRRGTLCPHSSSEKEGESPFSNASLC